MSAKVFAHSSHISHTVTLSCVWNGKSRLYLFLHLSLISDSTLCCLSRLWLHLNILSWACFIWNAVFRISVLDWLWDYDDDKTLFLFILWLVGFSQQGTRASTASLSDLHMLFRLKFACFYVICMRFWTCWFLAMTYSILKVWISQKPIEF